jgi:hypothetical protein
MESNPSLLKTLLTFSERFGQMLSRILLTVLYYGLLGPVALIYQRFADPLHLRKRPTGNWTAWEDQGVGLKAARRQD